MFSKDRLSAAREAAEITKAELARRSGLSVAAIQGYETGRRTPNAEQLAKVAAALGCSADYLLGLVTEKEDLILQRVKHEIREAFGAPGHD